MAEHAIALSSRVRLARNYGEIPFPAGMSAANAARVAEKVMGSLAGCSGLEPIHKVNMAELSAVARQELVERHMISTELANKDEGFLVEILNGQICLMVNEEDHLRIQAILPGLELGRAMDLANKVDDVLEEGGYAFDGRLGYLTACPTNTGTGMRASVMLHLPALTMLSQMGPIIRTVSRIGLTVRGQYGEGSEASGNLYQLSNQITLGRNESEILHLLGESAIQVIAKEAEARRELLNKNALSLEDRLMRSYGIFKNARRMDVKEFMQRISDIRLAADLGFLDLAQRELDTLLLAAQPAAIQRRLGPEASKEEIDFERAKLIRRSLA